MVRHQPHTSVSARGRSPEHHSGNVLYLPWLRSNFKFSATALGPLFDQTHDGRRRLNCAAPVQCRVVSWV